MNIAIVIMAVIAMLIEVRHYRKRRRRIDLRQHEIDLAVAPRAARFRKYQKRWERR